MSSNLPTPQELQSAIDAGLECEWLKVDGDGQHFEALVVSRAFEGKSRIERHRMVYAALGDRMRGQVHALSMRTLTPEEHRRVG
jgi:acid stress-induced BolA-like protein IbaG/YrbA